MSNFDFLIRGENQYHDALKDLKKAELLIDQPVDSYMFLRRGVEEFFSKHKEYDSGYKYSLNKLLEGERKKLNNPRVKPVLRMYIQAFNKGATNLKALTDRCNPASHGGQTKKLKSELSKVANLVTDFNSFIVIASKTINVSTKKFNENAIPKDGKKPSKANINKIQAEFRKRDDEIERLRKESYQKDKTISQLKIKLGQESEQLNKERAAKVHMLKKSVHFTERLDANRIIFEPRSSVVYLKNAAYTKAYDSLEPSFFINFRFDNENWYIVHHLFNDAVYLSKGSFIDDSYLSLHPSSVEIDETTTSDDFVSIPDDDLRDKFISLKRAISQVLKVEFRYTGSYYYNNFLGGTRKMYRNLLEINSTNGTNESKYDALVVMINPGGSKPQNFDSVLEKDFQNLDITKLVACQPDETQYQIVKVMANQGWDRVAVINTLDICNPSSESEIDELFDNNGNLIKEKLLSSIFHEERRKEFNQIVNNLTEEAPIIMGWGANKKSWEGEKPPKHWDISEREITIFPEYDKLRKVIFERVIKKEGRKILGEKAKKECFYYHPWPRNDEKRRIEWPNKIIEQIKN